jgi:type IV pilus assembly protein PilP
MSKMLRFSATTFLLAACLIAGGCGKNKAHKAVNDFMSQVNAEIPPIKAPGPIIAENFVTTYQTIDTRDPFSSLESTGSPKNYPNSILQQYTLDSLKLVGILEHKNKRWAMVTAPDEKIYRITVGTRIGKQQSLVTKIAGNSVFLQTDEFSSKQKKESVLVLQKN